MDTTDVARAYADRLADLYAQQSVWREEKAKQFPDDRRNPRSAKALAAASAYVLAIDDPEKHPIIGQFVELALVLEGYRLPPIPREAFEDADSAPRHLEFLQAPEQLITSDEFVSEPRSYASGFFFDAGAQQPTTVDFERLLEGTFRRTLQSWRGILAFVPLGPDEDFPEAMTSFFEAHGVPLNEEDDDA